MKGKDIKVVVDDLNVQYENHMFELKRIEKAIESLQDVCDHEYDNGYVGHDFHYSCEKCKFCGKERKC